MGKAFHALYDENHNLRPDYDSKLAARMIQLLSACKKLTPSKNKRPLLSEKVIEDFISQMENNTANLPNVVDFMARNATLTSRIAFHFNRLMQPMFEFSDEEEPFMGFGPGKNLERLDAITRADWIPPYPSQMNIPRDFAKRFYAAHTWKTTFKEDRSVNALPIKGETQRICDSIRLPFSRKRIMEFHAVPKSIKAYRGVGKTQAWLMGAQIYLQRYFYTNLPACMPLNDQSKMGTPDPRISRIDLSSASDTIIWDLLLSMISSREQRELLDSLKIKYARIKGKLYKVTAPMMGEALTFPIMSAYFTAVNLAVCDMHGYGHSTVRTYGDDIETAHFTDLCYVLTHLNHKVNESKSYPAYSKFTESCENHWVYDQSGSAIPARSPYCMSTTMRWSLGRRLCCADEIRLSDWLRSCIRVGLLDYHDILSFRKYFPADFPLSYEGPYGVPTNDPAWNSYPWTISLYAREAGHSAKSVRSRYVESLRPVEPDYHTQRRCLLSFVRSTPARLVRTSTMGYINRSLTESRVYRNAARRYLYSQARNITCPLERRRFIYSILNNRLAMGD
jgi:hypothetical protein